jgi:hypothetical protein
MLRTPWGSASIGLRVLPPPPTLVEHTILVDASSHAHPAGMGGNLPKAVALARSFPATDKKVLLLCTGSQSPCVYNLTDGLSLPPNTTVIGSNTATLRFAVAGPDPAHKGTCGALLNHTDFYLKGCTGPNCFTDLKVTRNASGSMKQCCDRCRDLAECTAYSYETQQGGICILKACPNTANKCETSPSSGATSGIYTEMVVAIIVHSYHSMRIKGAAQATQQAW